VRATYVLRNARNSQTLATHVGRASDPWSRLVGLLTRARVAPNEGLWIGGCSAVHTLGMRASIDLFFLDGAGSVMKIECGVTPNRLAVACRGAATVVELGAASAPRDVCIGDRLELEASAQS